MINADSFESEQGIETLIRSAGQLPTLSTEFRERTIEAAVKYSRSNFGWVGAIVTVVFCAAFLLSANIQMPTTNFSIETLANTDSLWLPTSDDNNHSQFTDCQGHWTLVDNFSRLRSQHAKILRPMFR